MDMDNSVLSRDTKICYSNIGNYELQIAISNMTEAMIPIWYNIIATNLMIYVSIR